MRHLTFLSLLVSLFTISQLKSLFTRATNIVQSCSSLVYCQGDLLHTVQIFKIFNDSKTFVDMSQVNPVSKTLENFRILMSETKNNPTEKQVIQFVNENFVTESEMEKWTPKDFTNSPAFLDKIPNDDIRNFAKTLVSFWPILGRHLKGAVRQHPEKYSIIPVPNGFIIPGGRFRELYYWDSYWIIRGLLLSEMYETVKEMLGNFIYLIKTYGFIPNGSRVYYLNRSQPPLFTMMVGLYLDVTNDIEWLKANIDHIETELLFWLNNRMAIIEKDGVQYKLAHYGPTSNTPRPESYAEDVATCRYFSNEAQKRNCYNALKSGAETGWDFSTRWFLDTKGSTKINLTYIDPQRVIPVDLNAFLCKSFKLLSDFYAHTGNTTKHFLWLGYSKTWTNSIENVLYDQEDGIWYDFDRTLKRHRKLFFPSNFAPLWTDSYNLELKNQYGYKAAKYFQDQGIEKFQGGIPTSLEASGEQWDLPNAWPPLQDFVIIGLHKTGNENARKIAKIFAERWILANMKGYKQSGAMYEKYDAVEPGLYGGGGEYTVQIGFGWTNGLALSVIDIFFADGTASSSPPRILKTFSLHIYLLLFGLLKTLKFL